MTQHDTNQTLPEKRASVINPDKAVAGVQKTLLFYLKSCMKSAESPAPEWEMVAAEWAHHEKGDNV